MAIQLPAVKKKATIIFICLLLYSVSNMVSRQAGQAAAWAQGINGKITYENADTVSRRETLPVINLLKMVNIRRDSRTANRWTFKNGHLVCRSNWRNVSIGFRYKPPRQYNLFVSFARTHTKNDVAIVCFAAGHQFDWDMGAYDNHIDGFEVVKGKSILNSPASRHFASCLTNNRRYACFIKIRKNSARAYINNKLIYDWKTDYQNATINSTWSPPPGYALGVAARSSVIFYSAFLIPIRSGTPSPKAPIYNPLPISDGAGGNPLLPAHERNPGEFTGPAPLLSGRFTSTMAVAARQHDRQEVQAALERHRRSVNRATATCKALLQADLRRVMTGTSTAETRQLSIMITAMNSPSFDAPLGAGFTDPQARKAWNSYMIALAEARGNYLARLNDIRLQYAGALRKAMTAAINGNHLAEAIRIHAMRNRLHRPDVNPLNDR